jgi:hypothetical protein
MGTAWVPPFEVEVPTTIMGRLAPKCPHPLLAAEKISMCSSTSQGNSIQFFGILFIRCSALFYISFGVAVAWYSSGL